MKRLLVITMAAFGMGALGLGLFSLATGIGQADLFGTAASTDVPAPTPALPSDSLLPNSLSDGARGPDLSSEAGAVPDDGSPHNAPREAPQGTMPLSVYMTTGETIPFILNDGSRRTVILQETEHVFAHKGATVWATATVEVSGVGVTSESAKIPASYFQAPTVLNGVRVQVANTRDINGGPLKDEAGAPSDARLVVSDGAYTLSRVSQYHWPFPDLLWQEGFHTAYSRSLKGDPDNPRHSHRGMAFGVPKHTAIAAWTPGEISYGGEGTSWSVDLTAPAGARQQASGLSLNDLEAVAPEHAGAQVLPGQPVGLAQGGKGDAYVHLGGDYELGLMLAEWYTAHASPVTLSYIKDWLVVGPFDGIDDLSLLHQDYLGGEAQVYPAPDSAVETGQVWGLWDNVVPGVVSIGDAVDPYPFSGWAWINGNYSTSAAYLATYIHSDSPREVVLHIGSSDMVKVWVEDQNVFSLDSCMNNGPEGRGRTIIVDQHRVPASLGPGWNRLLVKVAQGDGCTRSWQLSLRVSDQDGQPVPDLTINPRKDLNSLPNLLAPPVGETARGQMPESLATVLRNSPAPTSTPVPTPTPTPPPETIMSATPEPDTATASPPASEDSPPVLTSLAAGSIKTGNTSEEFRHYLVDPVNHRVQAFQQGFFLGQWGFEGSGDSQFSRPSGVAIDPENGWVYVTDTGNNRIQKFDATGEYLGEWGTEGGGEGEFNGPTGIAVDPETGRIYVVDTGNNRVQVFSDTAYGDDLVAFLFEVGSPGDGPGQFRNPLGIAVETGSQWFYVVDTGNHRVQKFNFGGVYFNQWGARGSGPGEFENPTGITLNESSRWVYVADTGNHRVQQFNLGGVLFGQWGGKGTAEGQFLGPSGLATHPDSGWVYVSDDSNRRLQMFNGSGVSFAQWPTGDNIGGSSSLIPTPVPPLPPTRAPAAPAESIEEPASTEEPVPAEGSDSPENSGESGGSDSSEEADSDDGSGSGQNSGPEDGSDSSGEADPDGDSGSGQNSGPEDDSDSSGEADSDNDSGSGQNSGPEDDSDSSDEADSDGDSGSGQNSGSEDDSDSSGEADPDGGSGSGQNSSSEDDSDSSDEADSDDGSDSGQNSEPEENPSDDCITLPLIKICP